MPPTKNPKRSRSQVREVEFGHDDGGVSNKDLLNAISQLTERMTDFETRMTSMVNEKIACVEKNCMEQIDVYKQGTNDRVRRIEKRMEDFEHQVCVDMNTARDEDNKVLDSKIGELVATSVANATGPVSENRIDELERLVRTNELVISGVPFVANERIIDVISAISKAINYLGGPDSIENCFRLPVSNTRRRSSSSIIVKFWGANAKNDFFKQYFATKKLGTSMIGFAAPARIYVNENLTKKNFEIFCKCRDLKKDGKIARFNTQRGRVVVRMVGSDDMFTISSMEQLHSLVSQHAAVQMTDQ